jgi:Zn-dependent M32 family carboxypeptidase
MADLNLTKLKQDINLLLELTRNFSVEKCVDLKNDLGKKVPYLFSRSNTLFNKIINKDDISQLNDYISRIEKIQKKETDVKKESEEVGQIMFDKYIKNNLSKDN